MQSLLDVESYSRTMWFSYQLCCLPTDTVPILAEVVRKTMLVSICTSHACIITCTTHWSSHTRFSLLKSGLLIG